MIRVKSPQDIGAGVLFIMISAAGLFFGEDLTYGSARQMGPGFFPIWLSLLILGIGICVFVRGWAVDGPVIEMPQFRSLLFIITAILVFGVLIPTVGLPVSVIVLVFIAAYARPNSSWLETALLATGLAIFAVLVFVYALGQPLPLWGNR